MMIPLVSFSVCRRKRIFVGLMVAEGLIDMVGEIVL